MRIETLKNGCRANGRESMHCYLCHVESGHLELKEHEAAQWLCKDELESVGWLPADLELVHQLEL